MSDIILVYHESNEQRATRDPRDQADERNQGVGFIFNPILEIWFWIERFAWLFGFKSVYRVFSWCLPDLPVGHEQNNTKGYNDGKYEYPRLYFNSVSVIFQPFPGGVVRYRQTDHAGHENFCHELSVKQ